MRTVRLPLLRGALFIIALAAIAFILARGDNPAQADGSSKLTYNPHSSVSVSDPNPGAAADLQINFSLNAPDAFPNVRTKSSIQFLPKSWGIHTPESDGANAAPVGSIGGTFNALSTLGILGNTPCVFPIPVPFTLIEASVDTSNVTSALDIGGGVHPGGPGYSGQLNADPDTTQAPGDLNLLLIGMNADEKHNGDASGLYRPFGSTRYSAAYRDVDAGGRVSVGDVRLTFVETPSVYDDDYPAGTIVQLGDGDLTLGLATGVPLFAFQANEKHSEIGAPNDVMDPGEGIYRDVNQPWLNKVTYGDIRLTVWGPLQRLSVVQLFQLPGGVTHYPDFLNQMFPPAVVGEPLARQFAAYNVLGMTAVSLNIVTYRPGQLPGYPAQLGYPNVVVILNPVAPVDMVAINMTSDLCAPLSLTSTNLGVSEDNPTTPADESGFVRLTNPKAEKSHDFTLVTTSQPDADDDGIENMLDSCPLTPNTQDLDGRYNGEDPWGSSPANPDEDSLDGACDPDPENPSPRTMFVEQDEDLDSYANRADNCPTVANGIELLGVAYKLVPGFTFLWGLTGDLIGPSNQTDTDGDDIGDACEGAEDGAQCANDADDDADGWVNDGCPVGGTTLGESGDQCLNATDDDGDGKINDGCPNVGGWWPYEQPWAGECDDALDNDGDGYVNDGCQVVVTPGSPETACDNNLDDDLDGKVNDGCLAVDPGDYTKTHITGHMHVVTLTQGVPIFKHGVKLEDLDGKESVAAGGSANYKVSLENKGGSAEDFPVAVRVVEGCGTVSGPSTVHVNGDASANAQYTVDFSGCAAGEYTVQADACHAGDPAPTGFFGAGACPGASDGLVDINQLDDAPRSITVVVGTP